MPRALILALLLPACVPITLPEAEEQCARNAAGGGGGSVAVGASTGNAAIGIGGGTVGIGVGTGTFQGTGAGIGMTFGGPVWPRLPPETVYVNCVRDRTGQDPTVNMTTALQRASVQ